MSVHEFKSKALLRPHASFTRPGISPSDHDGHYSIYLTIRTVEVGGDVQPAARSNTA